MEIEPQDESIATKVYSESGKVIFRLIVKVF